jgi:hypothetical protein
MTQFDPLSLLHIQRISDAFYHRCIHREATFDQLQTFILSTDVRTVYEQCFGHDHRIALTAFALAFFEIEPTLTGVASEFLDGLMTSETAPHTLTAIWTHYCHVFRAWKDTDCPEMLHTLCQMYWEYEINYQIYKDRLTPDEQTYYAEEKQKRQSECLSMMERMDNLATFRQFTPVFVDSQTSTLLIQTLRRAFWDRIRDQLSALPPQWESLFALFREIRGHLSDLVLRHRPGWLNEYDDLFDIDFFRQRIASESLSAEFWMPRCLKLSEWLIALDSAAREPQHIAQRDALVHPRVPTLTTFIDFLESFMTRLLEIVHLHQSVFSDEQIETP